MSIFQLKVDRETKGSLREIIKEIKILNEHLADLKKMIAYVLGFNVVKGKGDKNEK